MILQIEPLFDHYAIATRNWQLWGRCDSPNEAEVIVTIRALTMCKWYNPKVVILRTSSERLLNKLNGVTMFHRDTLPYSDYLVELMERWDPCIVLTLPNATMQLNYRSIPYAITCQFPSSSPRQLHNIRSTSRRPPLLPTESPREWLNRATRSDDGWYRFEVRDTKRTSTLGSG